MRLQIRLPEVRPDEYNVPLACPYGCGGRVFALHQTHTKRLDDIEYTEGGDCTPLPLCAMSPLFSGLPCWCDPCAALAKVACRECPALCAGT